MTQDPQSPFNERISEKEVADVLNMIDGARPLRYRPLPGDLEGDFNAWFDGGAVGGLTGITEYVFRNGVRARVSVLNILCLSIHFPDGREVWIEQQKKKDSWK